MLWDAVGNKLSFWECSLDDFWMVGQDPYPCELSQNNRPRSAPRVCLGGMFQVCCVKHQLFNAVHLSTPSYRFYVLRFPMNS